MKNKISFIITALSLCILLFSTSCVSKNGKPIYRPAKALTIQVLTGTASISGETAFTNTSKTNSQIKSKQPIPSFIMYTGETMTLDVAWDTTMTLTITGAMSDVVVKVTYNGAQKIYTVKEGNIIGNTFFVTNK